MKIELLTEPLLEFGDDNLCDDPKMGISIGGFFSLSNSTHRSEVHYGIIGSNESIEATIEWIGKLYSPIEPTSQLTTITKIRSIVIEDGIINENELALDKSTVQEEEYESEHELITKKANPAFPGFNKSSVFNCEFKNDVDNNRQIKLSSIESILDNSDYTKFEKCVHICDLLIESYDKIINDSISKPDICFIVIPSIVYNKLHSIPLGKGKHFNLRRYLKSRLIVKQNSIPVQLILEDTIKGTKKSLQDHSMQAWNFAVANYYKNGCTPWTLSLEDKQTCFIGISFHKVLNGDSHLMRSSIAQAFNYEGKGIVFIGKKFEWDYEETNTKAPHLSYEYSKNLIAEVLNEYKKYHRGLPPARVVIHKTTDFWNSMDNKDYAEVEGLKDGIHKTLGDSVEIDLVTIKNSVLKLFRSSGIYPPIRGTLMKINSHTGVLYTTGYIPYYETFPGVHIPQPIEVHLYEGESTLKKVCKEILALTKMNFNNCNYFDSIPITLRFAQKVGEIIQYIEEDEKPPNKYYYYM